MSGTPETTTKTTVEAEGTVKVTEETTTKPVEEEAASKQPKSKEQGGFEGVIKKAVDIANKFGVQNDGNINNQYIFNIDSMSGDISHVQKDETNTKAVTNAKQYKLHERQDCSEFVSVYKTSLHLAYAIAVSMFEYVPVSDLQKLSSSLLRRFPKNLDADGKEIKDNLNPFISLDDIISVIGAQTCKVSFESRFENVTERCVYFENTRSQVMENLWELFPLLRSEITAWLIETDVALSFRNAFSMKCFVQAIANIIKFDFADSINRLFPQLVSREENRLLLTRLMLELIKDDATKKNSIELLKQWASSPKWLWEVSLIVYGFADDDLPFAKELEEMLKRKFVDNFDDEWDDWLFHFVGGQMRDSSRLRSLVANVVHKLATGDKKGKNEYPVSIIYLLTISSAYQFVNADNIGLPLVAVDNKKQLEDLTVILIKLFSDFALRRGLFDVLEAYLNEIDSYDVGEKLLNKLKSYFYIAPAKSARCYGDIKRFLSQLASRKNKTAVKVLSFLEEKFNSKELATV